MIGAPGTDWHVQYRKDKSENVGWFATPEAAIEKACGLIDDGCDVYGIGSGPLGDSISTDQIIKIYALWAKANPCRE